MKRCTIVAAKPKAWSLGHIASQGAGMKHHRRVGPSA